MSFIADAAEKARTTLRTKATLVMTSILARRGIVPRCALCDFDCVSWHVYHCTERATAQPLAIAAVTIKHHDWLSVAFVADCATNTAAGEWH